MSIKKALSLDETAPKQKHVRACILYTWDVKGSGSFWQAIRSYQMLTDEIVVFKALITIHKVIRQGHPGVLQDAISQASWLESLGHIASGYGGRGYSALIEPYISFIKAKLTYHQLHPGFSGTFDYEEYVSLRGIDDPNEGFETINDLLGLLDRLDMFQKSVFVNLRSFGGNEARVAAFVPLIEESYGIYQFIVSMMTAMHQVIGSVEVLAPLRDKFNRNHYSLLKFYDECSTIKYLTSLVSIPKLTVDAPDFLARGPPTLPPRETRNDDSLAKQQEELQQRLLEQEEAQRKKQLEQEELQRKRLQDQQRQMELQRMQQLQQQQQQQQEQYRLQMQAQENQVVQARLMDAQSQLEFFRTQNSQDRQTIDSYNQKVMLLEQQLAQMQLKQSSSADSQQQAAALQEEVNQWKQKYEALAKLYAQLRKEHLELLTKFKTLKDGSSKVTDEIRKEAELAKAELKAKSNELTEALVARNRLKDESSRIRLQYEEELERLRGEISESKSALNDMSSSKGAEVQSLVNRFTTEQTRLEDVIRSKQRETEEMRGRLDNFIQTLEATKLAHQEEVSVLQASLDQALLVLSQQQKNNQEGIGSRDDEISRLRNEHRKLLYQMMDNVLQTCINTVMESVFEFDSTAHEGNSTAAPEYVLSLIEKAQQNCSDFSSSFVKLINGGDPKDVINTSNNLAHSVAQLLFNGKGVLRLSSDDAETERSVATIRNGAEATIDFFNQVKSASLALVPSNKQVERVIELSKGTQHAVGRVGPFIETLSKVNIESIQGDLGDAVEREMGNAARAIQEAAARLEQLLAKNSGPDLNVNSAILHSAMAITTAIANLIRCATASQQEIVAHGKGSTTQGAFYKKNNKWTEGLISAAQSVAVATTYLVEVADGLVQGTHSWEQLVVAAQEVGVATTQLVAASRVKSIPFSKTQDRLEEAAQAVREATKLLVKAAKDASKLSAEKKAKEEVQNMTKHEAKVKEMEQQVKILELEKNLQTARYQLGEMRKQGYHLDE